MVPNILISVTFNAIVSTVMASPRRSGVRGSPAARNAPLNMKNMIRPTLPTNIVRRKGSASRRTSGAALTSVRSHGAARYPATPSTIDKPAAVRNDW